MQFLKAEILHSFQLLFPFFQEGCPTSKVTLTQDKKELIEGMKEEKT